MELKLLQKMSCFVPRFLTPFLELKQLSENNSELPWQNNYLGFGISLTLAVQATDTVVTFTHVQAYMSTFHTPHARLSLQIQLIYTTQCTHGRLRS